MTCELGHYVCCYHPHHRYRQSLSVCYSDNYVGTIWNVWYTDSIHHKVYTQAISCIMIEVLIV